MPALHIDDVRTVLVVGAGTMGRQIGAVAALAGYDTTVADLDASTLDAARAEIDTRLARLVDKGRLDAGARDDALARTTYTTDALDAARSADVVIEAAVEKLDVKRKLFADLDAAAPAHAILATNSSTFPSSAVADATNRPDRVVNMHFFNPVLVMACVEVVQGPHTSDATTETTIELARRFGKQPVHLRKEIPGFVANRLLGALRDEALRLEADGVASFKDIDVAARTALGHPMGPFQLMDLVGIDVVHDIRQAHHATTGDPDDLPAEAVRRLYEQGRYGRKTGHGWYDYE